jgi:hypothetical protein
MNTAAHSSNESTSVMDITPEQATKWLENQNTHNRKLIQATVDKYAQDMREGRWLLTHQGIAFDEKGNLVDGQHRLWAIVLSGKTIPMRIFSNVPSEAMKCIDIGSRRSSLDVIRLSQNAEHFCSGHLAIVRAMYNSRMKRSHSVPVSVEMKRLMQHEAAIDFAIKHIYSSNVPRIRTALLGSLIARAYYSADHDKLIRFCDALKKGQSCNDAESGAVLLWRYLYSNPQDDFYTKYGKAQRALRAFLDESPITKLFGCDYHLFLLPEEQLKLC